MSIKTRNNTFVLQPSEFCIKDPNNPESKGILVTGSYADTLANAGEITDPEILSQLRSGEPLYDTDANILTAPEGVERMLYSLWVEQCLIPELSRRIRKSGLEGMKWILEWSFSMSVQVDGVMEILAAPVNVSMTQMLNELVQSVDRTRGIRPFLLSLHNAGFVALDLTNPSRQHFSRKFSKMQSDPEWFRNAVARAIWG